MCKLCKERGKTWEGSDPICAFDDKGKLKIDFNDNWNCATLGKLRNICHKNYKYTQSIAIFSEDEWIGVISYAGEFIILQWYKNRGRTKFVKIIASNYIDDINVKTDEEICLEFIRYFEEEME